MKNAIATTALILAAGLSANFSAYAQPAAGEGPFFTPSQSGSSTVARSTVKVDFVQARKAGFVPASGETSYTSDKSAASSVSRSAVKADYFQAQKAGTLPYAGNRG
jgi:hypothetical protein